MTQDCLEYMIHICQQILDPLAKRFEQLIATESNDTIVESDLLDLIDCFRGVAEATQIHSADFLFGIIINMFMSNIFI
jgi:hypothetical protein